MNFFDIFVKTLSNEKINSAIISSVAIILLGYVMRRKKVFDDRTAKVLTQVVLSVSIAALAFKSFMAPIKPCINLGYRNLYLTHLLNDSALCEV